MANTGFFHHIGTFLLFTAAILLVITCISAPVVNDLAILKVDLVDSRTGFEHVAFGVFGWCKYGGAQADECSPHRLGYAPAKVMESVEGRPWSDDAADATQRLTKSLVLHPLACALNFLAFLLALGASVVGSLLASLVAGLAFLVTVIAMAINFALFQIVHSNITTDGSGSHPYYGAAAWTTMVSAICSLVGSLVVFLTCCSARLHRRGAKTETAPAANDYGVRRRPWF